MSEQSPPTEALSATQRGERLIAAVQAREPLAWRDREGRWEHEDLEGADASGSSLQNADLLGAKLARARLEQTDLDGSSLRLVDLRDARMSGVRLRGADLFRARLDRADLSEAQCGRASFWGASLQQVVLAGARCRNADFRGANVAQAQLAGTVLAGALVDSLTYRRSAWSPTDLLAWVEAGATVVQPTGLPTEAAEALATHLGLGPELCLYFPRTLSFPDKALVEALLATFLAHESPHCQSSYEPREQGGALVRLSGLPLEELVVVADSLTSFFARPDGPADDKALDAAVERAVERALPSVVARATAPIAVLQAQLGAKILGHIDAVYAEVERTEIRVSAEIAAALRSLESEVIEARLDRSGWAWDAAAGRLIRSGAWAVGTGAGGNALWTFLNWAASLPLH